PAHMSAMFLNGLESSWELWITNLIRIKVRDVYPHSVFHLKRADVVEERSPALVILEVLSHMMREQDVPGVAAIHYPLRHVDAGAGHISAFVHVHDTTNRPAVDPRPNLQARIALERAADLRRALRPFVRTLVEDQ